MAPSDATSESDFNEAQVDAMLKRSPFMSKFGRWVSVGTNVCGVRLNWVTSLLAVIITWGFAVITAADPNAVSYFAAGKITVSTNFTWLYIITQDIWCVVLLYLGFSSYGKIKLGAPHEKPRYNDFSWFCMLFTCGVAVGLYVFGVAEPLYFYRQPTVWQDWSYDYAHTKVSTENDAQRAQQAIFMAVYHWGIHGWVPYILLALTAGLVSFRWGMPMTIRSCFYPLLGDHALGFFGDIIDSLSISTTTFGVCTSLGLGVSQLAGGLQFLSNIGCSERDNCVAAGGAWDINTYGTNNCFGANENTLQSCTLQFLSTSDGRSTSYAVIILVITLLATLSVLSGLNKGIKILATMAFTFGMVVCLTISMSDNTWYVLNVMVQTTGYYLQYVVQVGFDCEAFQQLGFEFGRESAGPNRYWGSEGAGALSTKMNALGLQLGDRVSNDCGDMSNQCLMGVISPALGAAIAAGGSYAAAKAKSMNMSPKSVRAAGDAWTKLTAAYGSAPAGIPCGSGWNTTHWSAYTATALGKTMDDAAFPFGEEVCAGLTGAAAAACTSVWTPSALDARTNGPSFPMCPDTPFAEVGSWGTCEKHRIKCSDLVSYYDDSNPRFMDWWTIFYWAWWITWAPFVGFFVALISRGRTIREVVIGGFICPTLFAIMWFSVFGGLAIKMERAAELALQVRPDTAHALVTCSEHYSGGVPKTPEAKKLAEAGYYMLSCIPKDDQIYRLMEPYTNLTGFLHLFLWAGLVIYFLTSSDSGSMVDDIVSASGLSAARIPPWQKVFWCWTEGVVALALVGTGGALKSLQNVSIIIGLPFTILLCMMVPSLYRIVLKEAGDPSIMAAFKFNTQLLDFLEVYKPRLVSPCAPATHLKAFFVGLFLPGLSVKNIHQELGGPTSTCYPIFIGLVTQLLYSAWIILHFVELGLENMHTLAYLAFIFFAFIVSVSRTELRYKYNVWGSPIDDIFVATFMWPWVLAQSEMAATTQNKDGPAYFASADEIIAQMAQLADGPTLPSVTSTADDKSSAA